MGSKHTPPRWWDQGRYDDECRAFDGIEEQHVCDGTRYTRFRDGSEMWTNLETGHWVHRGPVQIVNFLGAPFPTEVRYITRAHTKPEDGS